MLFAEIDNFYLQYQAEVVVTILVCMHSADIFLVKAIRQDFVA